MKVSVSESEIHPCYFLTDDMEQYSPESGDILLEMTEEEFREIDAACCEFEHAMSVVQGKINEWKEKNA